MEEILFSGEKCWLVGIMIHTYYNLVVSATKLSKVLTQSTWLYKHIDGTCMFMVLNLTYLWDKPQ